MLESDKAVLVVIDVQGKLARVVAESDRAIARISMLILGMQALEVPIILTAQAPQKIGSTIPEIRSLLPDHREFPRMSFSVYQDQVLQQHLDQLGRRQVVLCGFETHICLFQSALDLLEQGWEVFMAADAVSSRSLEDKTTALQALVCSGVQLVSVESALFAMLRSADHLAFKTISALIR